MYRSKFRVCVVNGSEISALKLVSHGLVYSLTCQVPLLSKQDKFYILYWICLISKIR